MKKTPLWEKSMRLLRGTVGYFYISKINITVQELSILKMDKALNICKLLNHTLNILINSKLNHKVKSQGIELQVSPDVCCGSSLKTLKIVLLAKEEGLFLETRFCFKNRLAT